MSLTHTIKYQWDDGGAAKFVTAAVTCDSESNESYDIAVGGAGTKKDFNFSNDSGTVRSVFIYVDGLAAGQTVALTTYAEEKGSQGSALDTFTLTQAGPPLCWQYGSGITCPLQSASDVASIKVINTTPNTNPATVHIRIGYNG